MPPHSPAAPIDADLVAEPDAHGQAAMILVESLIHGLIDSDAITVAGAVEVVDSAVEVQSDLGGTNGSSPANVRKSVAILEAISISLSHELPDDEATANILAD